METPLPAPVTPPTPAAFVEAQEWWNLMYADFETVRFVDGEPDYSGSLLDTKPSPLDEVFTSHFILYF